MVGGVPGYPGWIRGRLVADPGWIRGRLVVDLGQIFSTVLDPHFGPPFYGMPFCVKRRAGLAKLQFGPGF